MSEELISIQVIKNTLTSIVKEMFWTTVRAAKSSIIYETYDFSPALLDEDGNLIAIGTGVPNFIGIMPFIVRCVLEDVEREGLSMDPGDIFIVNDPYRSGTHLNDVGLVMPLFYDKILIATSAIKGHINDVGGMNPGSWGPNAVEIFQEGLIIPPTHLYRKGELNKEILRIILHNTRIPEYVHGDIEALASALRYAQRRINELCEKYGVRIVKKAIVDKVEEGKLLAKKNLAKLPKGEFFAEERIEKYENMEEDLRITVRVKITDDEFIADFSENPLQVKAPINTTYPGTYASVAIAFVAVTDPHVSLSQGYLDPIEVIAPVGTLFNATPPAPVSCYWETMFYAVDLIWKALAIHIPDKLTAGHFLSVVSETLSMIDPRDGKYKILCEPNPGGWGAGVDRDGESCLVSSADGETYTHPAEVLEREYPIRVECMKLNVEEGVGHGRFRGGFGLRKDYRILSDEAVLVCSINRITYPPWGVEDGMDGTCNHIAIIRDDNIIWDGGRAFNFKLTKGDVVSIRSGGGGGWGNPLEREPERVLEDYKNKLITLDVAKNVYGVLIDPKHLKVDIEATRKLREALLSKT
ncbi:MAG: hydantoinase B/oxoprolinase family protein [Aigarchaeota archaeon]|nr:hydantoinase B/oxoprolinase family protein [Aigarchaeota archaeon]MCX7795976.1 hydantoinase B/oxoprolinase family protein [bacterium]MDW7985952.1 hydantoinase B/oxoprolinase family protein [Nitrososphaerota archaeon]